MFCCFYDIFQSMVTSVDQEQVPMTFMKTRCRLQASSRNLQQLPSPLSFQNNIIKQTKNSSNSKHILNNTTKYHKNTTKAKGHSKRPTQEIRCQAKRDAGGDPGDQRLVEDCHRLCGLAERWDARGGFGRIKTWFC